MPSWTELTGTTSLEREHSNRPLNEDRSQARGFLGHSISDSGNSTCKWQAETQAGKSKEAGSPWVKRKVGMRPEGREGQDPTNGGKTWKSQGNGIC